jgi:hypothetical protein
MNILNISQVLMASERNYIIVQSACKLSRVRVNEIKSILFCAEVDFHLNERRAIRIAGVLVFIIIMLPVEVHAAFLTLAPNQATVTQGSYGTNFQVTIAGQPNSTYYLSATGVSGDFSPSNQVQTNANGYAYAVFNVNFGISSIGSPGIYCPGTSVYTITAASTSGDTGTVDGSVTILPAGPLQLSVSTDKDAYTQGNMVTFAVSLNRPADVTVTVTSPSGQTQSYPITYPGTTPISYTKSIEATGPFGTWSVTAQANDYCGVTASNSTTFVVNPILYHVHAFLAGIPTNTSAVVRVDGTNQGMIGGGRGIDLSFPNGTSHTLSVDEYIAGQAGIRFHCPQNTWSFNSAGNHTFNYQPQYQFFVNADPASVFPTISTWYDPGSIAFVNPPPVIVQGLTPGVKYVFSYLTVDGVKQNYNSTSFTMEGPHFVVAKYRVQYLLTVVSPNNLGNPQGSGYYDSGTVANFSVSTPVGYVVQQVFAKWTGDVTGTTPQSSTVMTKPVTVYAVWTTSYLQIFLVAGIFAAIAVILILRRRYAKSTATT